MLVVLSSATSARRIKARLHQKGISSEVTQIPKHLSEGGCSYGLRISDADAAAVKEAAGELRLHIKGLHEEGGKGRR